MSNGNGYPGNNDRGGYPANNDRGYPEPRRDERHDAHEDAAPAVPDGEYSIKAVSHKFGEASTRNLQIGVRVRITEGEYKGKILTWYGTFTDKSEDITVRGMRALGHVGDDIFNCDGFYDPRNEVIATGVVENERNPKTNKMVSKVKFVNGGGDIQMAKELSASDAARFRERMRGMLTRTAGAPAPSQNGGRDAGGRDGGKGWQAPPPRDAAPPRDSRGGPPQDDRPGPSDGDQPPWSGGGRGNRW